MLVFQLALAVLSLALSFSPARAFFSLTPINLWFKSACHPENISFYKTYVCDAFGHIQCLPGWTGEETLCQTPTCIRNGRDCVNGNCTEPNICTCEVGWTGELCDTCLRLPGCINGNCNSGLECNCIPGWTGLLCDTAVCTGCVHGKCTSPEVCSCDVGWSGPNCTVCEERDGCKYGRCVDYPFQCKCFEHFTGLYCDQPKCREGCDPVNGYCSTPNTCWCKPGWQGPNCTECVPYWNCHNGYCQQPWECKCNPGYFGADCNSTADISGNWGGWGSWSSCSVTCGAGEQTRTRSCNNPRPSGSGLFCSVDGSSSTETVSCRLSECLDVGFWGQWSPFSTCTVTCGGGTQNRSRTCNDPLGNSSSCPGSSGETQTCNTQSCSIIDGSWGEWTAFGACSVTCDGGNRTRTRVCDSPAPSAGGAPCPGLDSENQSCNSNACLERIDGSWGPWTAFSTCSVTCGGGSQTRTRICDSPAPSEGGALCPGLFSESQVCNTNGCPIDGGYTEWTVFSPCTSFCMDEVGDSVRRRYCTNPAPQDGGLNCTVLGPDRELVTCNGTLPRQSDDPTKACYNIF